MTRDIDVIAVLSGWGTGSTAVAGYLDRCGSHTCPPHKETIDERTPIAFEPKAYSDALAQCIDEFTLEPKGDVDTFKAAFIPWLEQEKVKAREAGATTITLKHPLQTYLMPVLDELVQPKYVVITRPFAEIEATRLRRAWHPIYGSLGAQQIYGVIYTYLQDAGHSYLALSFKEFRQSQTIRSQLLNWVGLSPSQDNLEHAESWVRK